MSEPRFHRLPDGSRIAFRQCDGSGPAWVFLPGYLSDMTGSKAAALFERARATGQACLLLDYSGCGASDGAFAEGTLTRWRDEVLALIEARSDGPVVLIGSSMGGWLMLLVALALIKQDGPDRIAGLVGIAAAPDFTDWGFSAAEKSQIESEGRFVRPLSPDYGGEPMSTSQAFWRSGQASLLLAAPVPLDCPVRLIHGQQDSDVPWETSLRLADRLRSRQVQVTLVKDGDHRLSRDADIALLLRTVEALTQEVGP